MSVLKTCPYCGGHGYINQFEDVEGGCRAWANECIACKGAGAILVPETNADRIRRMSDEELAWTLMVWRCDAAARYHGIESVYPDAQQTVLKWLQQPAVEDT